MYIHIKSFRTRFEKPFAPARPDDVGDSRTQNPEPEFWNPQSGIQKLESGTRNDVIHLCSVSLWFYVAPMGGDEAYHFLDI